LSLVVCQVRYDRLQTVDDPKRILGIVGELGADDWQVQERTPSEFGVKAGPGSIQASGQSSPPWRLLSSDGRWVVAIHNDFVALETAHYRRWSDFVSLFRQLVAAVSSHLAPTVEHRVGVRFVNEILAPDGVNQPTDWRSWIATPSLGPLGDDRLEGMVDQARQAVELQDESGVKVLLQHGAVRDDSRGSLYLLDIDCYQQRGRPFGEDAVVEAAEHLHALEKRLFRMAVEDRLYTHLQGDSDE
jgi:uncharacterized protein (TIGR04255 family)